MLKITGAFIGIVVLVGLSSLAAVYYTASQALTAQLQQTALAVATNLSDSAVPYVLRKDFSGLQRLLKRYGEFSDVAYIMVENRNGVVLAHNPANIPPERQGTYLDFRETVHKTIMANGQPAFVTRVALMNGEIGAVHVAVWESAIRREIEHALYPILHILIMVFLASILVIFFVARRISRPVLALARSADEISHGNFEAPVAVKSKDELGELGHSLERLRSSLKAAITRLRA